MRVLVVGAGAIGSLVGGRLAAAGHAVTLVGRAWLQEALAHDGLTIVCEGEEQVVRTVRTLTDATAAVMEGPYDYLLLTPKAYALPQALSQLDAAALPLPPLVTFQNGVGSEELAAAQGGAERVIAATITAPVEVLGASRIGTVRKGGVGLARWSSTGPDPAPLAAALSEAGLPTRLYDDARAMKWSKLLLNLLGNATSAILGWPPQRTMADPRLYDVELDALAEARAVMGGYGLSPLPLPGYPTHLQFPLLAHLPRWLSRPLMVRLVAGGRGGKMPSLYLALEAGRSESEVTVLNRAVAAQGQALGIPAPVNRALAVLVERLARGEESRAAFHHQPEALLRWLDRES